MIPRCSTLRRLRSDVAALPNRLRVDARRSIRANRRRPVRSVASLPSKTRRVNRRPHVAVNDVEIARSPSSNVGIVFSPGGFLVSYYLGVIECLTELKLFHKDTPISGTSAGALVGAFAVSGVSPRDCSELTRQIQGRLLHSGYGWKVTTILYETLEEMLPHDVHRRATDRIGIGVTIYTPKKGISGKVLTQYASRKEFIDAVVASCYIPYYLGPRLGVEWADGSIYSDGMPTHFFPDFPLDGSIASDHTITVSALPAANRRLFDAREVDISPDRRPRDEIPSVWKTLWNGLVPLRMEEVDVYHRKGFDDTLLWAQQCSFLSLLHKTPTLSV